MFIVNWDVYRESILLYGITDSSAIKLRVTTANECIHVIRHMNHRMSLNVPWINFWAWKYVYNTQYQGYEMYVEESRRVQLDLDCVWPYNMALLYWPYNMAHIRFSIARFNLLRNTLIWQWNRPLISDLRKRYSWYCMKCGSRSASKKL